MPYEMHPLPKKGMVVDGCDRKGREGVRRASGEGGQVEAN